VFSVLQSTKEIQMSMYGKKIVGENKKVFSARSAGYA
jgi:hypothetical protein